MESMMVRARRTESRPNGTIGLSEDEAWAAVVKRDATQHASFVYAVRSTGVYCRPTCPSRRPQRVHVSFFGTAHAAEDAGYRPCRRCRPHAANGTPTERSIVAAREFLDAHADEPVSLPRLARAVGLSPAYLQRTFTRVVGVSPKAYHDAHRRAALRAGLRRGATVTQASFAAGFGSASAAYRSAAAGVTPGEYRRGGRGLVVRYGIVPSSIGQVLVAATDRGVCAVLLGGSDPEVERLLARELPLADRIRDDGALSAWAGAVVQRIDGGTAPDVPLDLRGSDFQVRVWRALRDIPSGETRSYRELAASLGRPTAVRAVARACATNPAAVIVPCHRVISSSGDKGGYRWGVERKSVLLEREKRRTAR